MDRYMQFKKRAAQEVHSLLLEGYILLHQTTFEREQFGIAALRHTQNGNRIVITFDSKSIIIKKNHHIVKQDTSIL